MNLEQRIQILAQLGEYIKSGSPAWEQAKHRAHAENGWFIPEFIDGAVQQIVTEFLQKDKLTAWVAKYQLPQEQPAPKKVGVIMAGNIPLVGFHDMLSVFISGHRQLIKTSSRDETLLKHLVNHMISVDPQVKDYIAFAERLNGCDAYIATGSNNSARYFDYYFGKYPNIIRRNRTSVALLSGEETREELEALADDVNQYFGLGCRNVTQIYVPENYDFLPLLDAFKKYDHLSDLAKYKHNYDYQLTLLILNKKFYMTNGAILLTENESPFSPISVLHYQYYQPGTIPAALATGNSDIQCIVGHPKTAATPSSPAHTPPAAGARTSPIPSFPAPAGSPTTGTASSLLKTQDSASPSLGETIPFGQAQRPTLEDYADGVDTLQFLRDL